MLPKHIDFRTISQRGETIETIVMRKNVPPLKIANEIYILIARTMVV
jgi:hypothetical protein